MENVIRFSKINKVSVEISYDLNSYEKVWNFGNENAAKFVEVHHFAIFHFLLPVCGTESIVYGSNL